MSLYSKLPYAYRLGDAIRSTWSFPDVKWYKCLSLMWPVNPILEWGWQVTKALEVQINKSLQKRPISLQKRPISLQKRPISLQKRPISLQKRPISLNLKRFPPTRSTWLLGLFCKYIKTMKETYQRHLFVLSFAPGAIFLYLKWGTYLFVPALIFLNKNDIVSRSLLLLYENYKRDLPKTHIYLYQTWLAPTRLT